MSDALITALEAEVVEQAARLKDASRQALDASVANLQLRRALGFLLGHQDSNVVAATESALARYGLDVGIAIAPRRSWWARRRGGAA